MRPSAVINGPVLSERVRAVDCPSQNRNFFKAVVLLSIALGVFGCRDAVDYAKQRAPETTNVLKEGVDDASKAAAEQYDEVVKILKDKGFIDKTTDSVEEFKKLHQMEYQILEFDSQTSKSLIEIELNSMGKNRWDCYQMHPVTTREGERKLRFYCKRRPDTPLRYVPRSILR